MVMRGKRFGYFLAFEKVTRPRGRNPIHPNTPKRRRNTQLQLSNHPYVPSKQAALGLPHLLPLALPAKLHKAAQDLGVFPSNGLRTFARAIDQYHVGTDTQDEAFINIQIRIAPGRPEELRQRIVDSLFASAEQTLAALIEKRSIGLQLEITELDRSLTRMAGSLPTT